MPLLPSQIALLSSALGYPALLRLLSGSNPTAWRFSKSIKAISTLHSSLLTILAITALRQLQWQSSETPGKLSNSSKAHIASAGDYPNDSHNPFITARSEFANTITAIEAGYLIQDIFVLLHESRLHGGVSTKRFDKTLMAHHVGIGSALLILHYYISRGREAGIYVIVMFLLMNSSTPLLNIRWYLRNFMPEMKKSILVSDAAFVVSFFMARIWLISKILAVYGTYHGWTALETFRYGLRTPCKVGTGSLWAANVGWWTMLVMNTLSRTKNFTFGGQ